MVLDYQTNVCYLSKWLLDYSYGMSIVQQIAESGVDVRILDGTSDIWLRDFMPVQVDNDRFIGYEYTPDYLDNPRCFHYQTNPARIIRDLCPHVIPSGIIMDGGNVVKTSKGVIMVDKIFEENYHISKIQLVNMLETLFIDEIIFLPWDKKEKYGHSDGIVREVGQGRVLLTNYHQYDKGSAEEFMRILSKYFEVDVLDYNVHKPCKYNWCYINFLQIGNKIFIPQLTYVDNSEARDAACPPEGRRTERLRKWYHSHIEEDDLALEQFRRLFVGYDIIQLSCPQIVEQGGALNCISWNIRQ